MNEVTIRRVQNGWIVRAPGAYPASLARPEPAPEEFKHEFREAVELAGSLFCEPVYWETRPYIVQGIYPNVIEPGLYLRKKDRKCDDYEEWRDRPWELVDIKEPTGPHPSGFVFCGPIKNLYDGMEREEVKPSCDHPQKSLSRDIYGGTYCNACNTVIS